MSVPMTESQPTCREMHETKPVWCTLPLQRREGSCPGRHGRQTDSDWDRVEEAVEANGLDEVHQLGKVEVEVSDYRFEEPEHV